MHLQEREFVPVAALERDQSSVNREEAASTQAKRVASFQRSDIAGLMDDFGNADHFSSAEFTLEGGTDRIAALDRVLGDLVIDRVGVIQLRQASSIACVEALDPGFHDVSGSHPHEVR